MGAKSALGPFAILALGVLSAAAVFGLHRALVSDQVSGGPAAFAPPEPTDAVERRLGPVIGEPGPEPVSTAEGAGEAQARLEPDAGQVSEERAAAAPNPHIEALRHPSPVYRNVSLTTVIRDAGYECLEILSATAGTEDLGTWRVSCDGAHAYMVSEDGVGGLRVEPMMYFDQPTPLVIEVPVTPSPGTVPLEQLDRRPRFLPPPD